MSIFLGKREVRLMQLGAGHTSGDIVAWVRIEGLVRELYDVAVLSGRRRPAAVGLLGDDIRRFTADSGV